MASDPTLPIEDFAARLGANQRLFGLDLGTKTIGVSMSDLGRSVATALIVIRRKKFTIDTDQLLALAAEHEIGGLVLGLPLNMDGSEGPRAQATRAFARNLAGRTDLPMTYWDERLSTVAAERVMIEADMSRSKRAAKIDAAAASFILQGALDRMRRL